MFYEQLQYRTIIEFRCKNKPRDDKEKEEWKATGKPEPINFTLTLSKKMIYDQVMLDTGGVAPS
jgi:hypothetical protein